MQQGMFPLLGGETTGRPKIDTFCRKYIIFGRFFRAQSLQAESEFSGVNFYILVPSLGLPKFTARFGSSPSTAEKKRVRRHGGR